MLIILQFQLCGQCDLSDYLVRFIITNMHKLMMLPKIDAPYVIQNTRLQGQGVLLSGCKEMDMRLVEIMRYLMRKMGLQAIYPKPMASAKVVLSTLFALLT